MPAGAFDAFHMVWLRARHEQRADIDDVAVVEPLAEDSGLDLDRFRQDMADPQIGSALERDHRAAVADYGGFRHPDVRIRPWRGRVCPAFRAADRVRPRGCIRSFDLDRRRGAPHHRDQAPRKTLTGLTPTRVAARRRRFPEWGQGMSTRWFGTQVGVPKHADLHLSQPQLSAGDPSGRSIFSRAEGFWRSWLATGARRVPIDRRRARGAESYLKKVLVGGPSGAVDFSSAMSRQAIDEALHELPPQHKQVVKLAYFGGLTNREIAQELGLTVSEVRRVLRASLAIVGAHFERGRAKGRRAIQGLLMVPWWRVGDGAQKAPWPALDHALQTGIVAVMTAAAAALLVTHQAPVHIGHTHRPPHAITAGSVGSNLQSHTATPEAVLKPSPRPAPVANPVGHPGSVAAMPAKAASLLSLLVSATGPPVLPKLRVPDLPQLPFGE